MEVLRGRHKTVDDEDWGTCESSPAAIWFSSQLLDTYLAKTQRVRDPVHGLIGFDALGEFARRDQIAWQLINTPEFQRLRRVRQLGVSEFTFPGATHTRFAHSIGVFHTARALISVLRRQMDAADFDTRRADRAVLAALLHDIGHGPFSHAFESVQERLGDKKHHEQWTADIIRRPDGAIFPLLESFQEGIAEQIAILLESDNPQDIYHAVVSSSFDADRLDYLQRDRYMTGSGSGAIDFIWLLDNIRTAEVSLAGDEGESDAPRVATFCLSQKAAQPAEAFLLARYHLFQQIYLHKTTRGVECLLGALIESIATAALTGRAADLGLGRDDPLVRFFEDRGGTVPNYLELDDYTVWTAMARIAQGSDAVAAGLATRIRDRRLLKCFDIDAEYPPIPGEGEAETEARRREAIQKIDERLGDEVGTRAFKDVSPISAYGEVGSDQTKAHKRLMIMMKDGNLREITQIAPAISAIVKKRSIIRYYFATSEDRKMFAEGT